MLRRAVWRGKKHGKDDECIQRSLCSPVWFILFLIRPPELSGNYQEKRRGGKQEKLGDKMATEFCLRSISFILVRFLNILKAWGRRFIPSEGCRATDL
jgi:hypothetical protein